jgi:hypothetical protein
MEVVTATAYEWLPEYRRYSWAIFDQTVYTTQYSSEEPWHVPRQQRAFVTVSGPHGDLDVATSSHIQALRVYVERVLGNKRPPYIAAEYDAVTVR